MMKKRSLSTEPSYRDFVRQRDLALEQLHRNAQMRITDYLSGALNLISDFTASTLARTAGSNAVFIKPELEAYDRRVDQTLGGILPAIMVALGDLDRRARLLAHAGETEAIGRVLRRPLEYRIGGEEPNYEAYSKRIARVALGLDRVRRDIVDSYQSARVAELNVKDALERIESSYPKVKRYRRGPVFLRAVPRESLREADEKAAQSYSFGILDEQEWEQILDEFKKGYVPTTRGPDAVFDVAEAPGELVEWYGWEIEQEMTDSFVRAVRNGQQAAAKEQGITDFVWLAVLDNRTDECCEWRDGLTSAQIADRLGTDKQADECQVTVPPAHFNCRCTMAPVTDETPTDEPYNPQDFEDWLNTG